MQNIKRGFWLAVFIIFGAWLNYLLPQHDVVRVVHTENKLQYVAGIQSLFYADVDTGPSQDSTGRDLRLIATVRKASYLFGLIDAGTKTMVYRNEDTGWIYPPYFKFDSADLHAEAAAASSNTEPYQWMVLTHYGWRIPFITVYPNAVSIRPAPSEDYRPFPWLNLIILSLLLAGALFVRAMWRQFRERTLERFKG